MFKKPKISVFSPSFNKSHYAIEGIQSVLNQSFGDFEYWIIENSNDDKTRSMVKEVKDKRIIFIEKDFTDEERKANYPTALLLNEYYPKANGEYIFYISDDDLIHTDCFANCIKFFEENPLASVVYFPLETTEQTSEGNFNRIFVTPADNNRGLGTGLEQVDCVLDGGQIMHKRECLNNIDQPYFPPSLDVAGHVDGIFLTKLAQKYTFYAMSGMPLLTHRRLFISTMIRPNS